MHERFKKVLTIFLMTVLVGSICIGMSACGSNSSEPVLAESDMQKDEKTSSDVLEQNVAVKAGDVVFYADELQTKLDALLEDYELVGAPLSDEKRAEAAQEIIDEYAIRALVKAQLEKLGVAQPDKNTLYDMRTSAQNNYEIYWQKIRNLDSSEEYTDKELTDYLEENGITVDYFFDTLLTQYEMQEIMDRYDIKVDVTDEDVDAFYEENYVKPCRERYENNIPLFEEEVVYGDYESAYTPEGFRLIHQIVIPIPEDIQKELNRVEDEAAEAAQEAEDAYNKVAELGINGKDSSGQAEIYHNAMDRIDKLDVEYGKLWQSALKATEDESDEIYARMMTGESFDDLMKFYDPDDIVIYHPQSENWPTEFMDGAATLKKKGDISQPTLCSDGVHILYYYDDVPSGALELENASDREQIRQVLTEQRMMDALKQLTDPWAEEFGLQTDISVLKY